MNILVIFTGGTIGSIKGNDSIGLNDNAPYRLIDLYKSKNKENTEFTCVSPYRILSENLNFSNLALLKKCIDNNINNNYDGIIITHGSDTIQYTASFLDYIYGAGNLPIMVTASNYVLDDLRSNGLKNFRAAVDFISNRRGKGVFVPYQNADGICYVHRGNTLLPHLPYDDELYEINRNYYGKYSDDEYLCGVDNYKKCTFEIGNISDWESHIMVVSPYPGMKYPEITSDIKAILHYTYHSGTICADNEGINNFVQAASEKHIPIYIAGCAEGITYDSCKIYSENKFINLGVMAPAAAYMLVYFQSISSKRV